MSERAYEANCAACAEFLGHGVFFAVRKGLTVWERDDFVVLPALGSLTRYYLILEPRFHVQCFAQLSPRHLAVACSLCEDLISRYEDQYSVIVFEHGERSRSIEHAHLNILVLENASIREPFLRGVKGYKHRRFQGTSIASMLREQASRPEHDYMILYDHCARDGYGFDVSAIPDSIQRQFFRRILAEVVDEPWNWLASIGEDNLMQAYDALGSK